MAELREARRHAEEVVQCPRRVGAATARRSRAAPDGISERSTPAIAIAPHTPTHTRPAGAARSDDTAPGSRHALNEER